MKWQVEVVTLFFLHVSKCHKGCCLFSERGSFSFDMCSGCCPFKVCRKTVFRMCRPYLIIKCLQPLEQQVSTKAPRSKKATEQYIKLLLSCNDQWEHQATSFHKMGSCNLECWNHVVRSQTFVRIRKLVICRIVQLIALIYANFSNELFHRKTNLFLPTLITPD